MLTFLLVTAAGIALAFGLMTAGLLLWFFLC